MIKREFITKFLSALICSLVLVAAIGSSISYCNIYAEDIYDAFFSYFDDEIYVGDYIYTSVYTYPSNGDPNSISYGVDDDNVISIDSDGVITGLSAGTASAYIYNSRGEVLDSKTIYVRQPVESIELDETYLNVSSGDYFALKATTFPDDAYNNEVRWYSSNEDLVYVYSDGEVSVNSDNKLGSVDIYAEASDGRGAIAVCRVDIGKKVNSVKINDSVPDYVDINGKLVLSATVKPDDAVNKKVHWESSDNQVINIDKNNKVALIGIGEARIRVRTDNGYNTDYKDINVVNKVKKITTDYKNITVPKGYSDTLNFSFEPRNATFKEVILSSSNDNVVSVYDYSDNIYYNDVGEAVVTAKAKDGLGASVDVHITVKDIDKCYLNDNVGWEEVNYKQYWYEKSGKSFIKQAVAGDPKNIIDTVYNVERGREIYDPCSDAWYWLDANADGAKAEGKEVWVPYIYQNEDSLDYESIVALSNESDLYTESYYKANMSAQVLDAILNKKGKWVRYDSEGKMAKGWYTVEGVEEDCYPDQIGNTYYYDYKTGLMAKGWTRINGRDYYFDENTGVLQGSRW